MLMSPIIASIDMKRVLRLRSHRTAYFPVKYSVPK